MKNSWLLIPLGTITILLVMLVYQITSEDPFIVFEEQTTCDEQLIAIGADPSRFTPFQKQIINESDNLNYVKEFHEEDYSGISVNPIIFERDWGESGFVEWEETLDLDTDIFLFEGENDYLIILTFTRPYSYHSDHLTIGYIDFRYSNNFDIHVSTRISYLDDDKEYLLSSRFISPDSETGMYPIDQNTKSVAKIIKPELVYTYIIAVQPTADNDLETDLYLGMDIDFYMMSSDVNKVVQIGFNQFKPTNSKYLVTRKSVQYRRETNA